MYPLAMTNIAIENGHLQRVFRVKIVIFLSYVKLPEDMPVIQINKHRQDQDPFKNNTTLGTWQGMYQHQQGLLNTKRCPLMLVA